MDYEKAYKEVLSRAKTKYDSMMKQGVVGMAENIAELFPELKESEDERILRSLKEGFAVLNGDEEWYNGITNSEMLTWLEKKSTSQVRTGIEWEDTIDDACGKIYSEDYGHGEYCHEQSFKWGFQEGVEWLEKQGSQELANSAKTCKDEQNPAWSEKDVYILEIITSVLQVNFEPNERFSGYEEYMNVDLINWLKALKERYTWKPSDEQMEALYKYVTDGERNLTVGESVLIQHLYNDLKKLKG